jgi:hypothetical protein
MGFSRWKELMESEDGDGKPSPKPVSKAIFDLVLDPRSSDTNTTMNQCCPSIGLD